MRHQQIDEVADFEKFNVWTRPGLKDHTEALIVAAQE